MFAENLLNQKDLKLVNTYPNNLPNIDYKAFGEELTKLRRGLIKTLMKKT